MIPFGFGGMSRLRGGRRVPIVEGLSLKNTFFYPPHNEAAASPGGAVPAVSGYSSASSSLSASA